MGNGSGNGCRVLHAALMPGPGLGAQQQMVWEKQAAEEAGLPWDVVLYTLQGRAAPSSVTVFSETVRPQQGFLRRILTWYRLRREFYDWLHGVEEKYDVILLRHSSANPFQWLFIRSSRLPVLTVHHSSEVPELMSQTGRASRIKAWAEYLFGRLSLSSASGAVGLTREILDYEKHRLGKSLPGVVWPNGVLMAPVEGCADDRQDVPELLFVASEFYNWHGLDRLLDAMDASDQPLVLHLVGTVQAAERARAERDQRIVMHGRVDHDYISRLSARCVLGLSSFALDRKGMSEACTLKVRQYLQAGLPVYSGHRDVFPPEFPYYQSGDADISRILAMAGRMKTVSRGQVVEAARPFISKTEVVKQLHQFLEETFFRETGRHD